MLIALSVVHVLPTAAAEPPHASLRQRWQAACLREAQAQGLHQSERKPFLRQCLMRKKSEWQTLQRDCLTQLQQRDKEGQRTQSRQRWMRACAEKTSAPNTSQLNSPMAHMRLHDNTPISR